MSLSIPKRFQSNRTALIDGDILLYRNGFAGECIIHDLYDSNGEYVGSFDSQGLLFDWLEDNELEYEGYTYCAEELFIDSLENVLHTVKVTIEQILERTNSANCEVYLTGPDNFREKVATTDPYKGTRSDVKPHHYQNIKDYLIDVWNASIIEGIEADDQLAIRYNQLDNAVICSLDKDLLQVSGYHYNWAKDLHIYINEEQGWRNFFKQMITGDSVDNIRGLTGKGEKAASVLDEVDDVGEMYSLVVNLYHDAGHNADYFEEQAILLWMLRDRNDSWLRQKEKIEKNL